jgi:hypothetical protein
MAYCIFLKSLRSLEEFRKNPHVKIPPKSPSTIFQILAKFKNQILIRKFVDFLSLLSARPTLRPGNLSRPSRPASPSPALACRPAQATLSRPTRPASPLSLSAGPARALLLPPPAPTPGVHGAAAAGLAPPPRSPRSSHRKRKKSRINSPSFPPLIGAIPPPLQARKPPSSSRPLKLLQSGH